MSNQILWDCHMHSSFSADSDTPMEDMIQEAIRRGLHGVLLYRASGSGLPADSG